MDTRKFTINGNEYIFYNSFRGNRSGFVHETELYKNGYYNLGRNKVQYYNRTWEVYTYQTVMKGLVRQLMDEFMENFKADYKETHGIKRLTEVKRITMMEAFENHMPVYYAELKELYSKL